MNRDKNPLFFPCLVFRRNRSHRHPPVNYNCFHNCFHNCSRNCYRNHNYNTKAATRSSNNSSVYPYGIFYCMIFASLCVVACLFTGTDISAVSPANVRISCAPDSAGCTERCGLPRTRPAFSDISPKHVPYIHAWHDDFSL